MAKCQDTAITPKRQSVEINIKRSLRAWFNMFNDNSNSGPHNHIRSPYRKLKFQHVIDTSMINIFMIFDSKF